MNRDAKSIKSTLRPEIERIKGHIRDARRPFDGDGYPFKQAMKELKAEGFNITYIKEKCHYVKA